MILYLSRQCVVPGCEGECGDGELKGALSYSLQPHSDNTCFC